MNTPFVPDTATLEAFDLEQLHADCGLSHALVLELVEVGVLQPIEADAPTLRFSAAQVCVLRRARRLCADFDVDSSALALTLRLLQRIERLERTLRAHGASLPQD